MSSQCFGFLIYKMGVKDSIAYMTFHMKDLQSCLRHSYVIPGGSTQQERVRTVCRESRGSTEDRRGSGWLSGGTLPGARSSTFPGSAGLFSNRMVYNELYFLSWIL